MIARDAPVARFWAEFQEDRIAVAAFAVIVTSRTGEVVGFRWAMARVADGEHAGAWMTIAVSPPVPIGNAI